MYCFLQLSTYKQVYFEYYKNRFNFILGKCIAGDPSKGRVNLFGHTACSILTNFEQNKQAAVYCAAAVRALGTDSRMFSTTGAKGPHML